MNMATKIKLSIFCMVRLLIFLIKNFCFQFYNLSTYFFLFFYRVTL
ncbi:Uncharacterized protein dnm_071340 [Desulfonema magnum]|uniref:Uncharacterized protein n=1 Tax=Desulfonema magnum TaxID=45655 RepID=A0A975BSM7_9BACT|nr:Uncharacterized protein dnm_071340 [Desulfonema magnum]